MGKHVKAKKKTYTKGQQKQNTWQDNKVTTSTKYLEKKPGAIRTSTPIITKEKPVKAPIQRNKLELYHFYKDIDTKHKDEFVKQFREAVRYLVDHIQVVADIDELARENSILIMDSPESFNQGLILWYSKEENRARIMSGENIFTSLEVGAAKGICRMINNVSFGYTLRYRLDKATSKVNIESMEVFYEMRKNDFEGNNIMESVFGTAWACNIITR